MKNLKYKILVVFIAGLAITSCSKFIEEENFSRIPAEQFFNDFDQAESALMGVYQAMADEFLGIEGTPQGGRGTWFNGNELLLAANTDESLLERRGFRSRPVWDPIADFSYEPDHLQIRATWIGLYAGVFRANLVLENIDRLPATSSSDIARKNDIIAQARFMRGFYHFYLMTLYGGVPILDKITTLNTLERKSVQEVSKFIESDWEFAYENMLSNKMDNNGRAGKLVAAAYLAKLNIYLASCKENNVVPIVGEGAPIKFTLNSFDWVNETERYIKAKDYSDMVYGNYSLAPNYKYLFLAVGEEDARQEMVFNIEFSKLAFNRQNRIFLAKGSFENGGGQGRLIPSEKMFRLYNTDATVPGADFRRTNLQGNIIVNGAPAEEILGVLHHTYDIASSSTRGQYFISKWLNPAYDLGADPNHIGGTMYSNYPLLRYADILLTRAEAHYKVNGGTRAGIPDEMLTEVRQRSVVAPATVEDLNTAYLETDFMVELMKERSRELCYEGWRRIDLFRTNTYKEALDAIQEGNTNGRQLPKLSDLKTNFDFYKMWYPIPLVEIGLSPKLVQNPGYLTLN